MKISRASQYLSQKSWYRPSHAVSLHLQMMMVKRERLEKGIMIKLRVAVPFSHVSKSILYFCFTLTIVLPLALLST